MHLTGDAPWQPSDICQPFRIEGGPADHTIRVTVTDALPQPPKNADRQGPTCRWREEGRFCLLQDYGGRYAAFAAREGDTTEVELSEGCRDTLSPRVILESAGLFDLLADFGMLILHSAYIVTQEGEGILFSGPSGAGKSTLSAVLSGNPNYEVTEGSITFMGQNFLELSPEERSWAGLFLSFQYPIEIPGVTIANFMKTAINEHRKAKGLEPLKAAEYLKMMKEKMALVEMDPAFASRGVNVGFSGGEKKRNEILQMLLLSPSLALIDEIDSGLDVDALALIASVINRLKEQGTTFIIISHYDRLYELVNVNKTAVMVNGKIQLEGDASLAKRISKEGYSFLEKEYGIKLQKEEKVVSLGSCAVKQVL